MKLFRRRKPTYYEEPDQPHRYTGDDDFQDRLRSMEREDALEIVASYALAAADQIRHARGAHLSGGWWVNQGWLANHPTLSRAQLGAEALLADGVRGEVRDEVAGWFRDIPPST